LKKREGDAMSASKRAEAYFNAGLQDFTNGNFWGAADSLADAARIDPGKSDYFYHYGLALARIPRRMHEAEENLKKAVEMGPLKPEYYLALGALYVKSGLAAKALAVYDRALQKIPGSIKIMEAIRTAGGKVPDAEARKAGLMNKLSKGKK
jgi:tetratricopeptide (TPR) repeat protein